MDGLLGAPVRVELPPSCCCLTKGLPLLSIAPAVEASTAAAWCFILIAAVVEAMVEAMVAAVEVKWPTAAAGTSLMEAVDVFAVASIEVLVIVVDADDLEGVNWKGIGGAVLVVVVVLEEEDAVFAVVVSLLIVSFGGGWVVAMAVVVVVVILLLLSFVVLVVVVVVVVDDDDDDDDDDDVSGNTFCFLAAGWSTPFAIAVDNADASSLVFVRMLNFFSSGALVLEPTPLAVAVICREFFDNTIDDDEYSRLELKRTLKSCCYLMLIFLDFFSVFCLW